MAERVALCGGFGPRVEPETRSLAKNVSLGVGVVSGLAAVAFLSGQLTTLANWRWSAGLPLAGVAVSSAVFGLHRPAGAKKVEEPEELTGLKKWAADNQAALRAEGLDQLTDEQLEVADSFLEFYRETLSKFEKLKDTTACVWEYGGREYCKARYYSDREVGALPGARSSGAAPGLGVFWQVDEDPSLERAALLKFAAAYRKIEVGDVVMYKAPEDGFGSNRTVHRLVLHLMGGKYDYFNGHAR